MKPPEKVESAFKMHLRIILLYILLGAFLTWPVIADITASVAGSGGDPWQTMWRFSDKTAAWQAAWQEGNVTAFITREFFGQSDPQLVNLSVWPWMGLHWLFGQPTAYNLVWLLSFVLSGYGMYLLVRLLIPDQQTPAWLAGVAYMFLPFHVAHAQGHFGAMQTQWLPLIMAVGVWWYRAPHWLKALVLGLLLIIQAWTEHHYLLWLGICAVIFFVYARSSIIPLWNRPAARRHSLILLTAGLIIGLSYWPTIRLALQPDTYLTLGQEQTIRFSADAFSYIIPAPFHSLWGKIVDTTFASSFTGNAAEATQFLGFTILLAVLFFRHTIPVRQKRFWLIVGSIFYVISLGPRLHILGYVTPIPLPYDAMQYLPIFSSIRTIARAGIFVDIAMVVLFAYVVRAHVRKPVTVAVLTLLILLEFSFLPQPTQSTELSPFYNEIAAIPGTRVIEIPAATNYDEASRALYAATIHGKEVLGSIALERAQDEEDFVVAKSYPALRQLLYLRTTDIRESRSEFFDQDLAETLPDVLRQQKVSAILIHKDSISPLQLATVRNFLEKKIGYIPAESRDEIMYAALDTHAVASDGIFLVRGDGFEGVSRDVRRGLVFAGIPREAYATIFNLNEKPVEISLAADIQDDSKVKIQTDLIGFALNATTAGQPQRLIVPPGETVIRFINQHSGPSVIINPQLRIPGSTP